MVGFLGFSVFSRLDVVAGEEERVGGSQGVHTSQIEHCGRRLGEFVLEWWWSWSEILGKYGQTGGILEVD